MDGALVIAGTSFVGRHLRRHLAQRSIPYQATARAPQDGCLPCDLTRPNAIDAMLQAVRPRWIFACAGTRDAEALHALHVTATETLLDAAARHVPDAVTVLFGSAAEYGPVPPALLPVREDTPARPVSSYGQSKLAQLRVAEGRARTHGLRVHVVRPFNLIGPGIRGQLLAAVLCRRLRQARHGAIPVANGHATRDWVDARDAVDAVVRLALDASPAPGTVGLYNIATGEETSVLTLAEHLCRLAGDFHAVDTGAADASGGIDRSCGDASRLRTATGWTPCIDWRQSVRELWDEGGI